MTDLIIILLSLSLVSNIVLITILYRLPKSKKQMSYDATALLSDLASGPALIKVEYVDRADVLLRSPRHL